MEGISFISQISFKNLVGDLMNKRNKFLGDELKVLKLISIIMVLIIIVFICILLNIVFSVAIFGIRFLPPNRALRSSIFIVSPFLLLILIVLRPYLYRLIAFLIIILLITVLIVLFFFSII